MNILIVAATPYEVTPLYEYLEHTFDKESAVVYTNKKIRVHLLVTGIGLTATAYAMGRYVGQGNIDFAINMGIAGAFDKKIALGTVVHVVENGFGDLGIEQADGTRSDLFDSQLAETNQFPFTNRVLKNPTPSEYHFLPAVKSTSVQTVHGCEKSITAFRQKHPDIQVESMEGAAFFWVCLHEKIPFIEIRAVSNYVEKRDKTKWNIPLAITNLNKTIVEMLETIGS